MQQNSAIAITAILFLLSIFQLLLVLKYPLGEYAWGGQHKILPNNLRLASISSVLIYILISVVFLSITGLVNFFPKGAGLEFLSKFFAVYFTLGIPLNLISKSKKERLVMAPLVSVLAVLAWAIIS